MFNQTRIVWLVGGLGVAQLLAWGALYYAITVLGGAIRTDLGVTQSGLFGSFTWALTLSGLAAPYAGRMLDQYGGRVVLIGSTLLGALGFIILARTQTFSGLLLAWSINGIAMAFGLYETCFATIGQVLPSQYPRAVTGVTLIAGFASTVFWPASHYLLHAIGWRQLCDAYAGCLCLCSLIYFVVLPSVRRIPHPTQSTNLTRRRLDPATDRRARLLAWTFSGLALIGGSFSAHLVAILEQTNISSEQAVWVASSIGVMQVLGRLLHVSFGSHHNAVQLGLVTFLGCLASTVLLLASLLTPWFLIPFAVFYGIANGLVTIAKATLPVQIFGVRDVGQVLGTFSRPSLVTRALAPLWFAMTTSAFGTAAGLAGIAAVSVASCLAYVATTRQFSPSGRDMLSTFKPLVRRYKGPPRLLSPRRRLIRLFRIG